MKYQKNLFFVFLDFYPKYCLGEVLQLLRQLVLPMNGFICLAKTLGRPSVSAKNEPMWCQSLNAIWQTQKILLDRSQNRLKVNIWKQTISRFELVDWLIDFVFFKSSLKQYLQINLLIDVLLLAIHMLCVVENSVERLTLIQLSFVSIGLHSA